MCGLCAKIACTNILIWILFSSVLCCCWSAIITDFASNIEAWSLICVARDDGRCERTNGKIDNVWEIITHRNIQYHGCWSFLWDGTSECYLFTRFVCEQTILSAIADFPFVHCNNLEKKVSYRSGGSCLFFVIVFPSDFIFRALSFELGMRFSDLRVFIFFSADVWFVQYFANIIFLTTDPMTI